MQVVQKRERLQVDHLGVGGGVGVMLELLNMVKSKSVENRLQNYTNGLISLEDLMMNEAIRLSLLEAEEAEKKRKEEETKKASQKPLPSGPMPSTSSIATSSTSSSAAHSGTSSPILDRSSSSDREAALSSAVQTSILPSVQDLSLSSQTTTSASRRTSQQLSQSSANNTTFPSAAPMPQYLQATTAVNSALMPDVSFTSGSPSEPRGRHLSEARSYEDNASVLMGAYGTSPSGSYAPSINPLMSRSVEPPSTVLDTPASEMSEDDYGYGAYAQLQDEEEEEQEGGQSAKRPTNVSRRSDLMDL